MIQRFFRALELEGETYLLGLARVLIGALLFFSTVKVGRFALESGYPYDFFHLPVVPEALVPSKPAYVALLSLRALAALCATAGFRARPALLIAAGIGLHLIACDRLEYHNNRYLLELLALLLAFAPCDRCFRLGRPLPAPDARRGPLWAQRLMQFQVSLVYAASAGSKLFDADWRGGQVLHVRYEHVLELAAANGHVVPSWASELLHAFWFADVSSKAAIFTELFLGLGLWLPPARAIALWIGVMLHFGIEIAAHVEVFSFLMWAAYVLFCVPTLRERKLVFDASSKASRFAAWLISKLDVLARFEVVTSNSAEGLRGSDRDGRIRRGIAAWTLVARGIPLFFPLWLPLAGATLLFGERAQLAGAKAD